MDRFDDSLKLYSYRTFTLFGRGILAQSDRLFRLVAGIHITHRRSFFQGVTLTNMTGSQWRYYLWRCASNVE